MPLTTTETVNVLKLEENGDLPTSVYGTYRLCKDYGKASSKPLAMVGKDPMYLDPNSSNRCANDSDSDINPAGFIIRKGCVHYSDDHRSFAEISEWDTDADDSRPVGVEIPYRQTKIILRNGDEDYNKLVTAGVLEDFPISSFQCLIELFGGSLSKVLRGLISGSFVLLDFTTDSRIKMTDAQKKDWRNYYRRQSSSDEATPPAIPANRIGYTAINYRDGMRWHRSGTCLFEYNGKRFLTGQDEGTYFGVELSGQPDTVNEAYVDLIPEQLLGKKWQRQGEWFVVPVKSASRCWKKGVLAEGNYDGLVLPRDEDGNIHMVSGEDVVVTQDGVFALDGSIEHDQHETIRFAGWVTFVKNTAVRSVSVEGVD